MKLHQFALILPILFFFTACQTDDETCRETTLVQVRIGLYTQGTTTAAPVDSITVKSIENDSVYYNNTKKISKIALALDHSSDLQRYAIRFNNQWDTLTLIYNSEPYFVSYACGMIYIHQLDTVLTTNHVVTDIRIQDHLITTADAQHIQIYR